VLIKVGQFLSARADVLPEEITAELSGLQDEVPPEDFDEIRRLLESELGSIVPSYSSIKRIMIRIGWRWWSKSSDPTSRR
jgi:predicted unusual protein kinase regulating ubiquinone biosynthesis (AarF/ABC1/UbiB family)